MRTSKCLKGKRDRGLQVWGRGVERNYGEGLEEASGYRKQKERGEPGGRVRSCWQVQNAERKMINEMRLSAKCPP